MHIVCAQCNATNNIPEQRSSRDAKCGRCGAQLHPDKPIELNAQNHDKFVPKNDMPVLVDYWASWCGPCISMAPVFEKVGNESDAILFAKLNTEHAQQISVQAGIRSIPTLILYYQGKEVDRVSGALAEPQLKQWLVQTIQELGR